MIETVLTINIEALVDAAAQLQRNAIRLELARLRALETHQFFAELRHYQLAPGAGHDIAGFGQGSAALIPTNPSTGCTAAEHNQFPDGRWH